jgi:hypothetical protein
MKRVLMIITACFSMLMSVEAQRGLHIAPLFEGKIIPQQRMVETRVKGKMLSKYQLTLFRSVRFNANTKQEIAHIHDLIELDKKQNQVHPYSENYSSKKSRSKETLMLQLPKEGNHNRFLCYKRNNDEITVIYMEGTLSSLDTLRELIK